MQVITKQQFADWLVNSTTIQLTSFEPNGRFVGYCGWRYHFTQTPYGLTMIDEHSQKFHILNDRMIECFTDGISKVWATYQQRVLVYTRV